MVNIDTKLGDWKMSMLNDAGSIASIVGIFIGIGAFVYAVLIKRKVDRISEKQKDNSQTPYKINTNTNMNEIHGYFRDVIRLTRDSNPDKSDFDESVDFGSITAELETYYQQNITKMNDLLNKSNRDLLAWYDLDKNVRPKIDKIISNFNWLINDFFEINDDQEMQTRIWTDNHQELLNKKFEIEKILNDYQKYLV